MIPLKDENPTRRPAIVTVVLIAINVLVYFGVQPDAESPEANGFTFEYAAIPCEVITAEPLSPEEVIPLVELGIDDQCNDVPEGPPVFPDKNVYAAVLFSMFLHGGFLHIAGNMLFLWIFGNNIEDHLGHVKFLAFYVLSGVIATIAHVFVEPSSTIPVVGASGAVAGVMGAYLVWFPNVRIRTLFLFFFILLRDVTAKWLLVIWFFMQFLEAVNPATSVAWMAHVGGFAFGVAVGLLVRASRPIRRATWTHDYERY